MKKVLSLFHTGMIFSLFLLSCSFNGNGPSIDSVSITDGQVITDIHAFHEIDIVFTESMNQYITEKNISISGYYDPLSYRWASESKALRLTLSEPLREGCEYTLNIGKSCESTEGYDLGEDFSCRFFTYENDEDFLVLETSPQDGQMASSLNDFSIVITFSHPVEHGTLYDKIELSPELNYLYSFSEERNVLTLDVVQPLDTNKIYTVTIKEGLRAHNGKSLKKDYTFSFHTILSTDTFSIESAAMVDPGGSPPGIDLDIGYSDKTEGIEKNMDLLVSFGNDFYLDSVKSGVSIEPACSYRLEKEDRTLRFIFDTPMKPEETYTITFDESILNIYGISLDREYCFEWVVNGESSRFLRVDKIEIVNPDVGEPDIVIYDNGTIYHNKAMLVYTLDGKDGVDFTIAFSTDIDVYSSLDSKVFLMYKSGNSNATSGTFHGYSWDSEKNILTITFSLELVTEGGDALYKFILTGGEGGIVDTADNPMEENIEIYVIRVRP